MSNTLTCVCGAEITIMPNSEGNGYRAVIETKDSKQAMPNTMIIYQKCPKCDGQGTVSKPPWVDGDVNEWFSTTVGGYKCNVCHGAKIIPMPNKTLEINQKGVMKDE